MHQAWWDEIGFEAMSRNERQAIAPMASSYLQLKREIHDSKVDREAWQRRLTFQLGVLVSIGSVAGAVLVPLMKLWLGMH